MAVEKIYVDGTYLTLRDGKYGPMMSVNMDFNKFVEKFKPLVRPNGKIRFTITEKKAPGKFGDTHSMYLDTFEPKQQAGQQSGCSENLPF